MKNYELDQRYASIRAHIESTTPRIKPKLRQSVFSALPENLTGHCEKHGDFDFYHGEWLSGIKVLSTCHQCVSEREESINALALERYQQETQTRLKDRLTASGVSGRNINKSFDTYQAETPAQKKAHSMAVEYARCICEFDDPFNLIMVGTTGTGKTHLGHAITHYCITGGRTCATIQMRQLIAEYRESWRDQSKPSDREVIRKYGNLDGLVIDEIGVAEMSQNESVILFEILNERYENQKPTAFISNQDIKTVKEMLGDRVCDRLREDGVKPVVMDWESARGAN